MAFGVTVSQLSRYSAVRSFTPVKVIVLYILIVIAAPHWPNSALAQIQDPGLSVYTKATCDPVPRDRNV